MRPNTASSGGNEAVNNNNQAHSVNRVGNHSSQHFSARPTTGSSSSNVNNSSNNSDEPTTSQRQPGGRRLTRYLSSEPYQIEPGSDTGEQKVEVVAFCRNIQNPQVLRDAIKGFRGHQINYFVIDSCKVPAFPNDLFVGIDVRWLEMSNTTVQFHNNFLQPRSIR